MTKYAASMLRVKKCSKIARKGGRRRGPSCTGDYTTQQTRINNALKVGLEQQDILNKSIQAIQNETTWLTKGTEIKLKINQQIAAIDEVLAIDATVPSDPCNYFSTADRKTMIDSLNTTKSNLQKMYTFRQPTTYEVIQDEVDRQLNMLRVGGRIMLTPVDPVPPSNIYPSTSWQYYLWLRGYSLYEVSWVEAEVAARKLLDRSGGDQNYFFLLAEDALQDGILRKEIPAKPTGWAAGTPPAGQEVLPQQTPAPPPVANIVPPVPAGYTGIWAGNLYQNGQLVPRDFVVTNVPANYNGLWNDEFYVNGVIRNDLRPRGLGPVTPIRILPILDPPVNYTGRWNGNFYVRGRLRQSASAANAITVANSYNRPDQGSLVEVPVDEGRFNLAGGADAMLPVTVDVVTTQDSPVLDPSAGFYAKRSDAIYDNKGNIIGYRRILPSVGLSQQRVIFPRPFLTQRVIRPMSSIPRLGNIPRCPPVVTNVTTTTPNSWELTLMSQGATPDELDTTRRFLACSKFAPGTDIAKAAFEFWTRIRQRAGVQDQTIVEFSRLQDDVKTITGVVSSGMSGVGADRANILARRLASRARRGLFR